MKRLAIVLSAALIAVSALAQPAHKGGEKTKKYFERIQAEKIAFFTNELDLSPEEAQLFWPVYNQYSKELREAHFNTMKCLGNMNKADANLSDSERENRADAYVKALASENEILGKYHKKFKKVLPIEKVGRLYLAEEAFRMKKIQGLRQDCTRPKP